MIETENSKIKTVMMEGNYLSYDYYITKKRLYTF